MAFDKEETKQLENLFDKSFKRNEKRTVEIVCEAIDQVITPQFDNIYKEFDKARKETREGLENVKVELKSEIKYQVARIKEDIAKLEDKLDRIGKMVHEDTMQLYQDGDNFRLEIKRIKERVKYLELELAKK